MLDRKQFSLFEQKIRAQILDFMEELNSKTINCLNCSGLCCTQSKNSMQLELYELVSLAQNLKSKNLWNSELKSRCLEAISKYHLDRPIYIKNKLMRKNYTCPLFLFESFGCPLSFETKPLGCLNFNPTQPLVSKGEGCQSDLNRLSLIDQSFGSEVDQWNQFWQSELNVQYEKSPLPVAIVFLMDHPEFALGIGLRIDK